MSAYKAKSRLYKVYHIHTMDCSDLNQGYVGITRRSLPYRLSQHLNSTRPVGRILRSLQRESLVIDQLAMLPQEKALDLEYSLRPSRHMGWNDRDGGNRSTVFCPGCGKPLPKRRTGAHCEECNPCRFSPGHTPSNYGSGEKYRLTSPDGMIYEPEAFTVFCKEHGLTAQNLRQAAKGRRHHHKGWKAERIRN